MGVGGCDAWMPPLETPRGANQLSCKALGKIKYYNSPYQIKIGQTITFVCKIKAQDIWIQGGVLVSTQSQTWKTPI